MLLEDVAWFDPLALTAVTMQVIVLPTSVSAVV
jgi:hypothetical protein